MFTSAILSYTKLIIGLVLNLLLKWFKQTEMYVTSIQSLLCLYVFNNIYSGAQLGLANLQCEEGLSMYSITCSLYH